jgi:hypothetical protein
VLTGSGTDACDPELTKIALFLAAMRKSVFPRVMHLLNGGGVLVTSCGVIATRVPEDLVSTATGFKPTFYARHLLGS